MRVSGTDDLFSSVPLGVADPQLSKLKGLGTSYSGGELGGGGSFNHVYASGDVDIPENGEVLNVRVYPPGKRHVFILGKRNTPSGELFGMYSVFV